MKGLGARLRRQRARRSLDSIQVAKPCPARWEEMTGDDKVRFCAHCKLNVFNLSAMDVEEAARVIAEKDGRLCVRFYRRKDGTTLTSDCPVGVSAWRKRLIIAWSAAASACAAIFAAVPVGTPLRARPTTGMMVAPKGVEPALTPLMGDLVAPIQGNISPIQGSAIPVQGEPIQGRPRMGRIAMPRQSDKKP